MIDLSCPCGADHSPHPDYDKVAAIIATEGPRMRVITPDGAWIVPRVWIAYHGLKADELPELAKKWGWEGGPY